MAKVIAIGPGGRAQAPERADYHRGIIEAVLAVNGLNELWLSPPCRDYDHADEMRRGLYRSAFYFCSCGRAQCTRKYGNVPGQNQANPEGGCPWGGQRISCQAKVVTVTGDDGKKRYHVQYSFYDKKEAIRAHIAKHGPDPSKWPYLARAKRTREG